MIFPPILMMCNIRLIQIGPFERSRERTDFLTREASQEVSKIDIPAGKSKYLKQGFSHGTVS